MTDTELKIIFEKCTHTKNCKKISYYGRPM